MNASCGATGESSTSTSDGGTSTARQPFVPTRPLISSLSITMGDANSDDENASTKNDLFQDNLKPHPCSDDDESTADITALSSLASPSNATNLMTASAAVLLRGRITLLFVAFLFGSFNVVLRLLCKMPGPPSASVLSAVRGWLAVMCFVPALASMWRQRRIQQQDTIMDAERPNKAILWAALAFLNVALLFVESARASFLTQTSVVITPLISSAQKVEKIGVGGMCSGAGWVGIAV